jgi:hypothetical protein
MAQNFYPAPDAEELVVAYLGTTYNNVSVDLPPNWTVFPFILVTKIDGPDDMVTEYPCVQLDCFHTDRTSASTFAYQVHNVMKRWTAQVPVLLSDGVYHNIDGLYVTESPHYEDYASKEVRRYCMRYHIDLRCNQGNPLV